MITGTEAVLNKNAENGSISVRSRLIPNNNKKTIIAKILSRNEDKTDLSLPEIFKGFFINLPTTS